MPALLEDHAIGSASARARSATEAACAHCGLPVPRGLMRDNAAEQFCCAACDTAYHAIRSCGLEQYYEYLEQQARPGERAAARSTGGRYEEFDDPVFIDLYSKPAGEGARRISLVLEGMHCAACVWLLERLPTALPGVVESRADLGRSQLEIVWQPEAVALSRVARMVDSLGYALHPLRERAAHEARRREDRAALVRIGLAGALFANTMIIAFALYGSIFEWMEPSIRTLLRSTSAVFAALAVLGPGGVFIRGAISCLRLRALHMDAPIALALLIGLAHGIVNTVRGVGEVYFDTLTTLVFLLLIGRWIQHRQQRKAADSIELLYALTPSVARRIENGEPRTVPVQALRRDDEIEVRAGESIPVDGRITQGRSTVDLSLLTGESQPVEVGEGDTAAAGCINLGSPLRIAADAAGRETRIGRLIELIAEEARRKAPIARMADRVAARFVGLVLALSLLTFLIWLPTGAERAVEATVSLLIITCPCALGLATPLAMVASIGRAARAGVLVKGGDALEALAKPGTLILDKTGTLSTGDWRVVRFHGPDRLQPLIAAAERECTHPAARALVRAFESTESRRLHAEILNSVGHGVRAVIGGHQLTIGTRGLIVQQHGSQAIPPVLDEAASAGAAQGFSPVYIAEDANCLGVALLGDELRPEALGALQAIRAMGWSTQLLSGDDERIVSAAGQRLGFAPEQIIGAATPELKAEHVRRAAARGITVMVGDGVNDAAALSAATVGIAVHNGAEAALSAADVSFARPGLDPLVRLMRDARATTAAIRLNLIVSLGYNVIFGGLAIAGQVNPLVAAVLMPLSSVTVLALSFRGSILNREKSFAEVTP